MSFFDPPPPPEPFDFPTEPPEGRFVPGVVPLELVLARSDQAAIVLRSLSVFPDGIAVELDTYLRHPPEPTEEAFSGFGSSIGVRSSYFLSAPRLDSNLADDDPDSSPPRVPMAFPRFGPMWSHEFRFGVQFPDGTKVTTLKPYVPDFDFDFEKTSDEPRYGLEGGGGGGSDSHYEHTFFLWPLPGPGTLTIVCEWSEYAIAETATALDVQPILAAAQRAQPLWPEDAGRPSHRNTASFMATMHQHMRGLPPPEE